MTEFAGRTLNMVINIVPGETRTFRLPRTMPGALVIQSTPLPFPLTSPPAQSVSSAAGAALPSLSRVGGGTTGTGPGGGTLDPGGPGGGTLDPGGPGGGGPSPNPGVLIMDLLHGDQVVGSGQTLPPVNTPATGDPSWRLRLHLAPGTPTGPTYPFRITVIYTSVLPILTRRIPLAAFQQAFDKNWNGQGYVYASVEGSIVISLNKDLAFYYHLNEELLNRSLSPLKVSNARIGQLHLGTGADTSPLSWLPGRLPFIRLDLPVTRVDPNKRIEASVVLDPLPDITVGVGDFTLTVKLYLGATPNGGVIFGSRFESTLLDRIPTTLNARERVREALQGMIDPVVGTFGKYIKPWLLGADFEVLRLRHAPEQTSVDPFGGFIVVDYVGQEQTDATLSTSSGGEATQVFTDPFLFPDTLYVPRGDGDAMWKQPVPKQIGVGPVLLEPTTTPGPLSLIDHIVVVMMENRSFDHMLGYLSLSGRKDVEGLTPGPDGKPAQFNYFNGHIYRPEPITDTGAVRISPNHGPAATKAQIADGMMHFVSNYFRFVGDDPEKLKLVMGYYGAQQLPTYDLLAREFAICDHWFSSHLGPTWPNRFVWLTGDLNRDSYGEPEISTPNYVDLTPVETPTLFDHLTDRGVSWHYFQNRFGTLRAYTKYTFDMVHVTEYDNVVNGFAATVRNRNLPSVTFIDPAFGDLPPGFDDAPPCDLRDGQAFIANILQTLFTDVNPFWAKTMLIICYDEHGGFYDHVDPPDTRIPLLGQATGKLGVRVPALVVSPLTGRKVLKDVFEHTSIAATILRRFCSPRPPHMSARVTAARDLRSAITLTQPRDVRRIFAPLQTLPLTMRTNAPRLARIDPVDDDHALMTAIGLLVG